MTEEEKIQALKDRWIGQEERIDKIIEDATAPKGPDLDWTIHLEELPFIEEVDSSALWDGYGDVIDTTKYGKDLRGINLSVRDLKDINFHHTDLQNANLSYAKLQSSDLRDAKLQNAYLWGANLQNADLRYANFTNAILEGANFKDVIFDSDTNFGFNKIPWWKNIFQFDMKKQMLRDEFEALETERAFDFDFLFGAKGKYSNAQDIYRQLNKEYKNQGMHDEAGLFHYRERVCKRKADYAPDSWLGIFKLIPRFFNLLFFDILFGYGEKVQRVLFFMVLVILGSSLVYWNFGDGVVREGNQHINGYGEALYFSIVTFTTLGFGDFHPDHSNELGRLLKYWIAGEALCGALLISLALIAFARISIRD